MSVWHIKPGQSWALTLSWTAGNIDGENPSDGSNQVWISQAWHLAYAAISGIRWMCIPQWCVVGVTPFSDNTRSWWTDVPVRFCPTGGIRCGEGKQKVAFLHHPTSCSHTHTHTDTLPKWMLLKVHHKVRLYTAQRDTANNPRTTSPILQLAY